MRRSVAALLGTSIMLGACLHSAGDDPNNQDGPAQGAPKLSGVVTAPGGALAFNKPMGFESLLAGIFGKPVAAAITGTVPVSGVTVKLLEIDASGEVVGEPIAEAVTGSDGSYNLETPEDFVPGVNYIVRAYGTTQNMDARVLSESVDVDPIAYVTHLKIKQLTAEKSDLSVVDLDEAQLLFDEIQKLLDYIDDTDLAALGSVDEMTEKVDQRMQSDEELNNLFSNLNAAEGICGTVTDASNTAVDGVLVVARDYGNWVTRNKIRTDAAGKYCLSLTPGDYILGVVNDTSKHGGATEWWTTGGEAYTQIDGEKITIAATNNLTKDFQLEAGARISGTITATGGNYSGDPLPNLNVFVRNYQSYFGFGGARTDENGNYALNVIPGDYLLMVRNRTKFHYASAFYSGVNDPDGGTNRHEAEKITLAAGDAKSIDMILERGYLIKGTVYNNATETVAGARVRFQNNGAADRVRTNNEGNYRLWVKAGTYGVQSRGQKSTAVTVGTAQAVATVDFSATTGSVSGVVKNSAGDPVSQAKIFMYDSNGLFIANELSNSDGSFTVHSSQSGNHTMLIRIDDGRDYGSIVYDSLYNLSGGTAITVTLDGNNNLGDITLPDAGIVTGTVYRGSSIVANASVIVKHDGTNNFFSLSTLSDGTYTMSLPATTYGKIVAKDPSDSATRAETNVVVTAGATQTLDIIIP